MVHRFLKTLAALVVALGVSVERSSGQTAVLPPAGADSTSVGQVVLPASGVDSISSLRTGADAVAGAASGKPAVEAIPTPTAFSGGLVILGLLVGFRLIRRLRRTA
jgi:hypothetical protein